MTKFDIIKKLLFSKKICFINNSLQYLCLNELLNLNLNSKDLTYFVGYPNTEDLTQLKNTIKIFKTNKINLIFLKDIFHIKVIHLILKIKFFFLNKYDLVILGDYKYYLFREFRKLSKKVIYLDDGVSTLDYNYWSKYYKIQNYNSKFFTFFNLKIKIPTIKNNFRLLKTFSKKKKIDNSVTILGEALYEKKLVTKYYFEDLIRNIIKKNAKKKIFYFPHRKEKIIYKIQKNYKNLHIIKNKYNVETNIINNIFISKEIYGISTTALATLKIILDKNNLINFYNINIDKKGLVKKTDKRSKKSMDKHLEFMDNFSNYLKKNRVKTVKF